MLYITQSLDAADNLFDMKKATLGWVGNIGARKDHGFFTGDFVPVTPGDVITFGGAVTTQGWHLVAYDADRNSLCVVTVRNGIQVFQHLDKDLSLMQYTVPQGVSFLRPVVDSRFNHLFLLTKNRVFTAPQYRRWMTEPKGRRPIENRQINRDGYTVILNLEGEGEMVIGGESITFSPGTVVCIPPSTFFYKIGISDYRDIRLVGRRFGLKEGRLAVTQDDSSQSIEALMRLMLRIFWDPVARDGRILQQLYTTLEQIILYRLSEEEPGHRSVREMQRAIQTGYTDPDFTVEQAFSGEHYCPTHLRRMFKKETGMTPLEYLLDQRIRYAKKLMEENRQLQATVGQIATLSGFRDPSYFSRVFKKKEGITPQQYMKNTG